MSAPRVGDIVYVYLKKDGDDPDAPLPEPTAAILTALDRDWKAELTAFPPRQVPGWAASKTPEGDLLPIPYSPYPEKGCWTSRDPEEYSS